MSACEKASTLKSDWEFWMITIHRRAFNICSNSELCLWGCVQIIYVMKKSMFFVNRRSNDLSVYYIYKAVYY